VTQRRGEKAWLERLHGLADSVVAGGDDVRSVLVDAAIELTCAERGFFVRLAGGGGSEALEIEAGRNFDRETLKLGPNKVSRTVLQRVVERGRGLVTTSDVDKDVTDASSVKDHRVLAILCVPLGKPDARRVVYLDHRFDPDAFSVTDLQVLEAYADPASVALEALTAARPAPREALEAVAKILRDVARGWIPRAAATGAGASGSKKRVLLVDDHPVVRQGLAALIDQQGDIEVCGQAETAADALRLVKSARPDVALVDLSLKGTSGLELLKDLKIRHPELPTIVVTMHAESLYAERVLRAGARGYVAKQEATEKVLTAIHRVLNGELYVSSETTERMLRRVVGGGGAGPATPEELLSDRELQVFQLLGMGRATRQIAKELHLSIKTIETYRANIKKKLNLNDGLELLQHAVRWAQEQGLT
jgi:DNA-binding NarL/FixJ family response regulator